MPHSLTEQMVAALAAHGQYWCFDLEAMTRFLATPGVKTAQKLPKVNGSVAVIPVYGLLTKRGDWFGDGTDSIGRTLDAAAASRSIAGVILDIDSPGGSWGGLVEFAGKVRALRGVKPIVAVANPLAASAAYWVGAEAEQLVASPSSHVGSVGVYSIHMDLSKQLANEGIRPTIVYAGKHKVDANPYEPLTDEARAEMQRDVDDMYAAFVDALSKSRGVPRAKVMSDFGNGRKLSASRAKEAGMVDLVATLDETLIAMRATRAEKISRDSMLAADLFDEQYLQGVWAGTIAAPIVEPPAPTPEPTGIHVDALRARRERERRRTEVVD